MKKEVGLNEALPIILRLGNKPEEMIPLIGGNKRTALIMNAQDNALPEARAERLQREIENLTNLGLQSEELDSSFFTREPIVDFNYLAVKLINEYY